MDRQFSGMNTARFFSFTFGFSLICHGFLLCAIPGMRVQTPLEPTAIEVTSLVQPMSVPERVVRPPEESPRMRDSKSEPSAPRAQKPAREEVVTPPAVKPREPIPRNESAEMPRLRVPAPAMAVAPQFPDSPAIEKIYTSYYKIINEQLQRAARPPADFAEGQITVLFVVRADGSLGSVAVLSDASSANSTLQQTALQIVRNASPFPPFPSDLQKVDLTFNVVIYFREQT